MKSRQQRHVLSNPLPAIYMPQPFLPVKYLPNTRKNANVSYPRVAAVYLASGTLDTDRHVEFASTGDDTSPQSRLLNTSNLNVLSAPPRLVKQRDLKEQTRLTLFKMRRKKESITEFTHNVDEQERNAELMLLKRANRTAEHIEWDRLKPHHSPLHHSGLKFEKIKVHSIILNHDLALFV